MDTEEEGSSFFNTFFSFLYPDVKDLKTSTHSFQITSQKSDFAENGSPHHFISTTFRIPTYCNFCKEFIWGFTQQGHICSICGYNIHSRCLKKAPHSCRPSTAVESKISDSEDSKLSSTLFKHHFVEGNIPIGSQCSICLNSFDLFSFTGFRCSRCEKMVHEECKARLEDHLCDPRHKNLLYISHEELKLHGLQDKNAPLIAFINSRSGGQVGARLQDELLRCLDSRQVFDLNADHGPERGLKTYKDVPNLRVLVCGGDGSVGWVLNSIDRMKLENFPPVAILPLGTGNDLARIMGWGTGYSGEDLSPILDSIESSCEISLDRWDVSITTANGTTEQKLMNNYMSVGVDAEVALEFHKLRNERPELFTSQFINKFWYAHYGMRCMFSDIDEIANMVDLEVDGKRIKIPSGIGGIMILNLPSYAGGVNLWGSDEVEVEEEEQQQSIEFKAQAIDDRIIEIVAISGSFHMGAITVKLSQAIRIAQGSSVKVNIKQGMPVQVDGEPWLQEEPCEIYIKFRNNATMLCNSNSSETISERSLLNKLQSENHNLKNALTKSNEELKNERNLRIKLEAELKELKSKYVTNNK